MSTDANSAGWPSDLPELQEIDNLLQCNICFAYFETAMILPTCSHNYCSLCIRKYLNYKSNCPTCNTPVLEPELRNNKALDKMVQNFSSIRKKLVNILMQSSKSKNTVEGSTATTSGEPLPLQHTEPVPSTSSASNEGVAKRKAKDMEVVCCTNTVPIENSFRKVKSPTKTVKLQKSPPLKNFLQRSPEGVQPGPSDTASSDVPAEMISSTLSVAAAQRSILKADCPVCGVSVPQQNINTHLDRCLSGNEKKEALRSSKRKPLPKLVYILMSDKDLRKKLKEYNLSVQGNRQALIKRIQEYTLLYNSQCDSDDPKPVAEIVREVEKAEKTRSQLANASKQSKLVFEKGESEENMEKKKQEYAKEHGGQFQQLIEDIKRRRNKKKSQKTETVTHDSEAPSPPAPQSGALQTESSVVEPVASTSQEEPQDPESVAVMETDQVMPSQESALEEVVTEIDHSVLNKISDSGIDVQTTRSTRSRSSGNLDLDAATAEMTPAVQTSDVTHLNSGLMNFADSDSDFSTSAFPLTGSVSKSKGKTSTRGKKRRKLLKPEDKPKHPEKVESSEFQVQSTDVASTEQADETGFQQTHVEDRVGNNMDDDSRESTPSPSIFENATQMSSHSSSPVFGGPAEDVARCSPSLTPSLGFGPMETTSEQSSCSDFIQDVQMDSVQHTPNSVVEETPPRRVLRKRKNEQSTRAGSEDPTSSNEFENTKRKRRKATRK